MNLGNTNLNLAKVTLYSIKENGLSYLPWFFITH